ncbi:MAG: sigma-70 family RNA polymerase sigma factor [Chitinophagaceae bacterium]|nr:sigma-70 family RNA polymerase sigma factor [Chitinophagaceae bacterium]
MPDYNILPEDELVKCLRSGDEFAFTEIYNRFWEKLLAIGYYHTRDKQMAEDIVHEVMLSLWTRKAALEIHSLSAYLATAVKFAVFKTIARDKKRRELLAGKGTDEYLSGIEDRLDARLLQEYLHGVVEELPEKTRLVFTYSRVAELSVAEIGTKMGLSPKAVEYHMTKAIRALRNTLGKIKSFFI